MIDVSVRALSYSGSRIMLLVSALRAPGTKSCYRNKMTFEGEACDIHELFLSTWVTPTMFCLRCGGEEDLPYRWGIRIDGFYLKHPRARG
jgi:hypothetical protein